MDINTENVEKERGMAVVYLGLGSNLNEPLQQLATALHALAAMQDTSILKVSKIYQSEPQEVEAQPDFYNQVVKIKTKLTPKALLRAIHEIEDEQGRVREECYGPRTLDIDILLYGDLLLETEDLMIPHPKLEQRLFFLKPLHEVAPFLFTPDGISIRELMEAISDQSVVALPSDEDEDEFSAFR